MLPLRPLILFLFLALSLSASAADLRLKRMDLDKVLFGVEYTFQDEDMVNESGRMTMETPHKRKRFEKLRESYAKILGLPAWSGSSQGDREFKPGANLEVPGDGKHVLTMEPVTIEMNTPPRRFYEIRESGEKIFAASEKAKLVPYVNPAAERSGMGHVHVGAYKMADNPFYKYPNLLRNMMVYAHQHPSLMWGFAEAYDIGGASNITTLHNAHPLDRSGEDHLRQYDPDYLPDVDPKSNMLRENANTQEKAFFRAVNKFDKWYAEALKKGDTSDGLRQYLRALREEGLESTFYHYGMFNLEHLEWLAKRRSPLPAGYSHPTKATVEFRNFRPPSSPEMAEANAELLLTQMEKFSEPKLLVKPRAIGADEYNRFHSASVVADDWEKVKADLGRTNKLWDESVGEYVNVQLKAEAIRLKIPGIEKADLLPAYSPKFRKGTKFELRVPAGKSEQSPRLAFQGEEMEFQKVKVGKKSYWVTMLDVAEKGDQTLTVSRVPKLEKEKECRRWFAALPVKK